MPTPEALAREEIDRQLAACGWIVQDHKAMNIMAGPGVAVREFPLKTGYADYLLYVEGRVIGLVEAKPGAIRSQAWKLVSKYVWLTHNSCGVSRAHYERPRCISFLAQGVDRPRW